jgi:hypothetical protein
MNTQNPLTFHVDLTINSMTLNHIVSIADFTGAESVICEQRLTTFQ